jgi:solute:Na+ symporter, SSS family
MSHGLIALAIDPNIPKEQITTFLFQRTLPFPIAIVALLGFIAVIMSSADSYLNAAAGALVNDLALPLGIPLSQKQTLSLAKWTTLALGGISMYFAIAVQDILDILLKTYQFWGPTLVVPLIAILANKPLPLWGFWSSVLSGGLTVVVWNQFDLESSTHLSALIAGLVVNVSVYSMSYLSLKYRPYVKKSVP